MEKWPREAVYKQVLQNIEDTGGLFGLVRTCQLCHDARDLWYNSGTYGSTTLCDHCPIWQLVRPPSVSQRGKFYCANYKYKGKSLGMWSMFLNKNKGALRALARKVCLG